MFSILRCSFSFALSILLTCTAHAQGNLLTNGAFELGNTGFSSDATFSPGPFLAFGEYTVGTEASVFNGGWAQSDHTSGSGNFLIVDGISGAPTVAWRNSIALALGQTYTFRAYVNNIVSGQQIADPVMELRVNGATIAGPLSLPESPDEWQELSGTFVASSAMTLLEVVSTSTAFNGNDFGIDDVSLVAAGGPECFLFFGSEALAPNATGVDHLLTVPAIVTPVSLLEEMPVFNIPNDVRLQGTHLYVQVYMANPGVFPEDPIKMSNGLDITLGANKYPKPFGPSSGLELWGQSKTPLGGTIEVQFAIGTSGESAAPRLGLSMADPVDL